jgi:hypothetical protein
MIASVQLENLITGREFQEVCSQDELTGGLLTLTLNLVAVMS